jgi:hypothetical protein
MMQINRLGESASPEIALHGNHPTPTRVAGQHWVPAVSSVLFHPDFNRRPRNHTGSADLQRNLHFAEALAGFWLLTNLPPVGNYTPP